MVGQGPPPYGDDDKGPALVIASCITIFIIILFVVLRFMVRKWISKAVGWDDWTILFAVVGNLIGAALDFLQVHNGLGRPQYYLTEHQVHEVMKVSYGQWMQTFATLMWTKISICLFLLRIPVSKVLIRPLQAAIVFLVVSNIILTGLWIGQCRPVAAVWDTTIEGKCFSRGQLERIIISQAIISIISDFAFSAYPILILWSVQLKFSTKAALCALMGVGVITGACCIVRTVLNYQSIPEDKTYGGMNNLLWRLFEIRVGIVAACIPTLRPGWKWLTEKITTLRSSKEHYKLSDEVRLKHMGETPSAQSVGHQTPMEFGNKVSVDVERGHTESPEDRIRKFSTVAVDYSSNTNKDRLRSPLRRSDPGMFY